MDRHRWLVVWNAREMIIAEGSPERALTERAVEALADAVESGLSGAICLTEDAAQELVAALLGCGYAVGVVEPSP